MATQAATNAGLTSQQQEALLELFRRGMEAGTQPPVSEGRSTYQALTYVSVAQFKDGKPTGKNDLVKPGETCELTEQEAANLMAVGGQTGRQHPAVRPYSRKVGDLPRLLPRQLSGRIRTPAPPPPDSTEPRPDPPGSSHLIVNDPNPEANEPQLGDEQGQPTGAMDLPPRRVAAQNRTAAT